MKLSLWVDYTVDSRCTKNHDTNLTNTMTADFYSSRQHYVSVNL